MCSDTSPRNPTIKPDRLGVGDVQCRPHYPYQHRKVTIANIEARISYFFNTNQDGHIKDNGLRMIYAKIKSYQYSKLKKALVSKWGEPDNVAVEELQNAFGARYAGEALRWSDDTADMYLSQYAGTLDQSALVLVHPQLVNAHRERVSETPNPDASDL